MEKLMVQAIAIELFHADGKSSGIWYCSECRTVHATEEAATQCHGTPMCACGKPIEDRYYQTCRECRDREWSDKLKATERARFDAATKVPEAEYLDVQVFDPHGDTFYESVEDLREHYEDDDAKLPEYVWGCHDRGIPKADSE